MKRHNKRWFCITEDTYLNEDFFDVINETGREDVTFIRLGNTSNFIIDVSAFLKSNAAAAAELSDFEDEILDEGYEEDDLDKEVFARFQGLYEHNYLYFFDTDRLNDEFFLPRYNIEARRLKEKLLTLNQTANETMPGHFYLVPSFPSLASLAWQISSYIKTNSIDIVDALSPDKRPDCKACKTMPEAMLRAQRLYKEHCVICRLRVLVSSKKLRGYEWGEKKFFSKTKKHYPYLNFLRDVKKWKGFYEAFHKLMAASGIAFSSLESLKISAKLIEKLASVKIWYSAIPVVIEASRKGQ